VQFNAEDLPSGLYIYELLTPMFNLPAGRANQENVVYEVIRRV